ncbi:aminoglycoside phosphotransferase family protein [Nonomuraea deserti]|uniref:Aminoglycoside phosphotransferase family protein n=1 Tax=Nonomuraea deserti TaxID=1848322 RepID=A0A4R4V4Q8_9ACTN|nr:phosphotransferase [Nonomuraea deserti]TDD00159.1 aminoglycoside phosphotransferase family protein [Nonomuraea deserti]
MIEAAVGDGWAERGDRLPATVLAAVLGRPGGRVLSCHAEPIRNGTGAATGAVTRLSGTALLGADDAAAGASGEASSWVNGTGGTDGTGTGGARGAGDREVSFRVVRKEFRPLRTGRHAPYTGDPQHWAYWRREPPAYASGVLPRGPGLAAPRCYGVVDDVVYLEDVAGTPSAPRVAARRLGAWQAATAVPDVPWLAGHQLAQRLAVTEWTPVDVDPRIEQLWRRQDELLVELSRLPAVLSHGDFSTGNLLDSAGATVVLDWATLGAGPVGADLAALALSTFADPLEDYLAGARGRFDRADVELGYRATLALTGAGRVHWMVAGGMRVPGGYEDFVLSQAP